MNTKKLVRLLGLVTLLLLSAATSTFGEGGCQFGCVCWRGTPRGEGCIVAPDGNCAEIMCIQEQP